MSLEDINGLKIQSIQLYSQGICLLRDKVKSEVLTRIVGVWDIGIYIEWLSDEEKYIFDLQVFSRLVSHIATQNDKHNYHVNVSPTTIINPFFLRDIYSILSSVGFQNIPLNISFEVTEGGRIITDNETITLNQNIRFLRSLGIKVGLDDFPSWNTWYLIDRIETIDFIKIDKIYVDQYRKNQIDEWDFISKLRVLLDFINQLLGDIEIVVEWIEDEEIFRLVVENFWDRVTYLQWYFHGKPEKMPLKQEYITS